MKFMKYDVIIIGAGASGLMAAYSARANGKNVLIIEKNARCARKLMITGKGRCNVTNNCDTNEFISNVCKNGRFLYSAINAFKPEDTMRFFEERNVPLKTERGKRVFPISDKAVDVVDCLVNTARNSGVHFVYGTVNNILCDDNQISGVTIEGAVTYSADKVIISTGGASYPLTGSTGDGYKFANKLGHKINKISPSLIPVVTKEDWCRELQGVSLKNVTLKVLDKRVNKTIYSELGEMIFTHFGVSGPLVLSASAHLGEIEKDRYVFSIDLKPGLTQEQLDLRVLRDFKKNENKAFSNSLDELFPKALIPIIIKLSGIPPILKVNQINKDQRKALLEVISNLSFNLEDLRPLEEAIITRGGVEITEINPKTMESQLVKGLYFTGEIINIDAYTGGFNLQIAFSTGFLAGSNI